MVQITFDAAPDTSPTTITARAKGRLDHALRAQGWRSGLARKVALRSLGDNTLETVLAYIATQLDRADLADPRYVQSLAGAAWVDGDIDLSEPLTSNHGRYWSNLHLVAVTDERWRFGREDFLSKIPDTVRAWSGLLGDVDASSVGRDKPVRAARAINLAPPMALCHRSTTGPGRGVNNPVPPMALRHWSTTGPGPACIRSPSCRTTST